MTSRYPATEIVELDFISLRAEYYATPGRPATRNEPEEPEEFELTSLFHKGEDIIYLISDETIERVEKAIHESNHNSRLEAEVARAQDQKENDYYDHNY